MRKLMTALALTAFAAALTAAPPSGPAQNPGRIAEIAAMLPDEPGFPVSRIDNRGLWDKLAATAEGRACVKRAEALLSKPVPVPDDSVYLKTGWAKPFATCVRTLLRIGLAECLENKGRFLPLMEKYLEAVADRPTWMNPGHDKPHYGNYHGKYRSIDLNGSEAALNVAIELDSLKGKISADLEKRLMDGMWKHVFNPYLGNADGTGFMHWWFFGNNNWNSACNNQSVGAALRVIKDKTTRAKFIEGAERGIPYFLNGFSKEGYCQEGLDYWNYGFAEYLRLGHIVRMVTSGKVDLFASEQAKRCYLYAYGFQLTKNVSPQFGDGMASAPNRLNLFLGELVWPDLKCSFTAGMNRLSVGLELMPLFAGLPLEEFSSRASLPPFRYPVRTYFEDAQVLVCRPENAGLYTVSACIKGGHNGVPHNHNDAGQFIIAVGNTQMVQDPAGKVYDKDTFSSRRYNHPMLNSYAHAVPKADGSLQSAGRKYTAKVLKTNFTRARDEITLDLKDAYNSSNIVKLERSMVYDRVNGTVTVTDDVLFSKPGAYESPISTFGEVVKGSVPGSYTIVRESRHGEKRLDFTVDTAGAKWTLKEEKIPNPTRKEPTRWAVVMDEPAVRHSVTFRFSRGEMPPDIDWTVGLETGNPAKGPWTTNFFNVADQTVDVERIGDGKWRFTCQKLKTLGRTADVKVVLDVGVDGDKTSVSGKITNSEKGAQVFGFDGPYFAERYRVKDGSTKFYYPWSNGVVIRRFPRPDEKLNRRNGFAFLMERNADGTYGYAPRLMTEYPSRRCMMQFFVAEDDDREGLYYMVKDPEFGAKQAKMHFDPVLRTFRFGFMHRYYLHAGRTAVIPLTEMVRFKGDWHLPAAEYGKWYASVRPYVRVPDKVKDCSTLMLLICKQQNGEIVWPYKDFDKLGDAALAHGIRHIKILGRGPGGHDNLYPDYWPDPAQGGAEALRAGLAELKKRGIETYAYVNGQLIECGTTEYWKTGGGSTAGVLCRDGTRAHEAWIKYNDKPPHEFDVACPWDSTWRKRMLDSSKEAQALGFNGMYFDQVAKQWPWQCWADNHSHEPGYWVWTEDRTRYLKTIRDEMVKYDPDFILTSEGFCDPVGNSCAIHLGLGDASPVRQRFDENATFYKFPEMAFFALPELRTSDRYPSPHRTRKCINETAIAGYSVDVEVRYPADRKVFEHCENPVKGDYHNIYSPPIYMQTLMTADLKADRDYFKAVNDFRYRNRETVLRGLYMDTVGFKVETAAKDWMAKRWRTKDGRRSGIMVWNADAEPRTFKVSFDGKLIDVNEPHAEKVDPADPIPADSLRVYVFDE